MFAYVRSLGLITVVDGCVKGSNTKVPKEMIGETEEEALIIFYKKERDAYIKSKEKLHNSLDVLQRNYDIIINELDIKTLRDKYPEEFLEG